MKKYIIELYELYLFYFLDFLCFSNVHDYEYLKQKVKGYDPYSKEHSHMMDIRVCRRCNKRQALINSTYGKRYETINKEQ